jgi:hypothetical protein
MDLGDYLERLRAKPERVRRQIALRASGAITLVVFLGWLTAFVSSGTLALNSSDTTTPNLSGVASETSADVSKLLGAASAFQKNIEQAPPIRVIETNASSTLDAGVSAGEATVIPF